jgi:hypothetical protein
MRQMRRGVEVLNYAAKNFRAVTPTKTAYAQA